MDPYKYAKLARRLRRAAGDLIYRDGLKRRWLLDAAGLIECYTPPVHPPPPTHLQVELVYYPGKLPTDEERAAFFLTSSTSSSLPPAPTLWRGVVPVSGEVVTFNLGDPSVPAGIIQQARLRAIPVGGKPTATGDGT